MSDKPDYLDVNQAFFHARFEEAQPWDAYLDASSSEHRQRWLDALDRTQLTPEQTAILGGFTRTIHLLVLSGVWCGDCVRQGPIFHRIAEAAPTLDLRLIDREASDELTDLLRVNGAKKVPVAVYLSEDFFEVGRFGDRLLTVYRAKAAREVGAACDTGLLPPPGTELQAEVQEWVDVTERMHLILRTAPLLRKRYGD
ncbi:MAG: thioredoxin family protein [Armatimonadetes bacterium]|nr:thioredoxin family protein [Armatimonadota bacterium]